MSAIHITLLDNSQAFTRGKNEATRRILEAIGEAAVDHAKDYVPQPGKSKGYATGALRDSIGFDITDRAVRIFATMPYSGYVEMGTYDPIYREAQPFLRPAVNNHQEEYKDIAESIYRGDSVIYKNRKIVYDN